MTPRACCFTSSALRDGSLCHRCERGKRKPRKRPSSLDAFRFARAHAHFNVRGARRLAAWAVTL